MTIKQAGLLLLLSAIWGAVFLLIAWGLESFSPFALQLGTVAIAATMIVVMLKFRPSWGSLTLVWGDIKARPWPALMLAGLLMLAFLLVRFAQEHIESGLVAVLLSVQPIWIAILALFFVRSERLYGFQWVGLALGVVGVGVVVGVEAISSGDELFGAVLVLVSALSFSSYYLINKARYSTMKPLETALVCFAVGSVLVIPGALLSFPTSTPSLRSVLAMIAVGILPTVIGFAISNTLIQQIGAGRMALTTFLVPIFALFYAAILLNEKITLGKVGGLALILAGVALASRRTKELVEIHTPKSEPASELEPG